MAIINNSLLEALNRRNGSAWIQVRTFYGLTPFQVPGAGGMKDVC